MNHTLCEKFDKRSESLININSQLMMKGMIDIMDNFATDNFDNLTNIELLDRLEYRCIQYINAVKEFIIRLRDKKITEEEYEKFIEIGEKMGVELIDFSNTDKYKTKEVIGHVLSYVVDKAYDKNR